MFAMIPGQDVMFCFVYLSQEQYNRAQNNSLRIIIGVVFYSLLGYSWCAERPGE